MKICQKMSHLKAHFEFSFDFKMTDEPCTECYAPGNIISLSSENGLNWKDWEF